MCVHIFDVYHIHVSVLFHICNSFTDDHCYASQDNITEQPGVHHNHSYCSPEPVYYTAEVIHESQLTTATKTPVNAKEWTEESDLCMCSTSIFIFCFLKDVFYKVYKPKKTC